MKSPDAALDDLIKAATGEGSRGGKIIGHTPSGKPIYDSPGHEGHSNFTAQEHADAAEHHFKISRAYGEGTEDQAEHEAASDQHHALADKVEKEVKERKKAEKEAKKMKLKSADMALDDLIKADEEPIGKTKSGKSIYGDPKHPGHKDFSDRDRKDAIKVHKTLQASAANKEESDKHKQSKKEHATLVAKKSIDRALDDLIKAATGEGSRGGKK